MIKKSLKLKKLNKTLEREKLIAQFDKTFPWVVAGGISAFLGLQYLFNKNNDKKFEEINTTTSAKLKNQLIYSGYKGAYYNMMSGEVNINKMFINDPILNWKSEKILKHELVHGKQAETIARMDDGIEKLNYACLKRVAKTLQTPCLQLEITQIYNGVMSNLDKYKDVEIDLSGYRVNLKNYIQAIYTLMTNNNATYKDIPMVINESHYKEVRKAKGDLTTEEKIMAQKYYEALIDYPNADFNQIINPFSDYWNNLLEVEAYKENPGFYTFIRGIFNKT